MRYRTTYIGHYFFTPSFLIPHHGMKNHPPPAPSSFQPPVFKNQLEAPIFKGCLLHAKGRHRPVRQPHRPSLKQIGRPCLRTIMTLPMSEKPTAHPPIVNIQPRQALPIAGSRRYWSAVISSTHLSSIPFAGKENTAQASINKGK